MIQITDMFDIRIPPLQEELHNMHRELSPLVDYGVFSCPFLSIELIPTILKKLIHPLFLLSYIILWNIDEVIRKPS
jgi:hypothetical protein